MLVALFARGPLHDAQRVAHADDRRFVDAVFLAQVPGRDRVAGLVVRDRALVLRGETRDGLLQAEHPDVARVQPVLVGDEVTPLVVGDDERLVDDRLDLDRGPADRVRDHQAEVDLGIMRLRLPNLLERALAALDRDFVNDIGSLSGERKRENGGPEEESLPSHLASL